MQKPHEVALDLFAPLGTSYERWARILSLGQDSRWRTQMVDGLAVQPGGRALDVAAGRGRSPGRWEPPAPPWCRSTRAPPC